MDTKYAYYSTSKGYRVVGGTAAHFLKADGSLDNTNYLTTDTIQNVNAIKSFITSGGNGYTNHSLRLLSNDGSNPGLTFYKGGIDIANIYFDGNGNFKFRNSDDTVSRYVFAQGFKKDGLDDNSFLTAGGGSVLRSTYPTTNQADAKYIPFNGSPSNINLNAKNLNNVGLLEATALRNNSSSLNVRSHVVQTATTVNSFGIKLTNSSTSNLMGSFTVTLFGYTGQTLSFRVTMYKYLYNWYVPTITWVHGDSAKVANIEFYKEDDSNLHLKVNFVTNFGAYHKSVITDVLANLGDPLHSPDTYTLSINPDNSAHTLVQTTSTTGIIRDSILSANANHITTNTNQIGLSGNKSTSGAWNFSGASASPITLQRVGNTSNNSIAFGFDTPSMYAGMADAGNFAIGSSANLLSTPNRKFWIDFAANSVNAPGQIGGSTLTSKDLGGFTINTTTNVSKAEMILRHVWSANNQTFGVGGTSSATAGSMSEWGMYKWLNNRTVNGKDGFFGWTGDNDELKATSLAGTGVRMVTANSVGTLSTQAIPSSQILANNVTNAGGIDISGGNTIYLRNLLPSTRQDALTRVLRNELTSYVTNLGSTNYPAQIGAGIRTERYSSANDQRGFDIFSNGLGGQIYFKTFSSSATEGNWEMFASREWTVLQLGSYVTQASLISQLGNYATLNGVQTFSNTITFSQSPIVPDPTLLPHAVNYGFMANAIEESQNAIVGYVGGNYIPLSQKGSINGVATLDASGLIPSTQLPSYVDDVIEAPSLATLNALPAGEKQTGKIYVTTNTNLSYRWSGTVFVEISSGAVQSVNGQTGVVNLTFSDVGASSVNHTHTIAQVTGLQSALDGKVDDAQVLTNVPAGALFTDTIYTLPTATSTVKGGVEIFSDTVQSVASNSVTNTANRTYGMQLNSAGQAVVNVPWSNDNTTYTAGNGLTLSGTVFSLPVTISGSGNYITDVTQNTNGITVTKGSLPSYTLLVATSNSLGGVRLITDTVNNVAPNAATTTVGRSYAVQLNNSNQAIVNVPWTDNNTTYTSSNGIALTGTNFAPTFGTTANTIAQGNDSRINNGQTAFGYGDHNLMGYTTQAWVDENFVKTNNGISIDITGQNLNTYKKTGFYKGLNLTGAPNDNNGWWYVIIESHDVDSWAKQTATSFGSANVENITYQRVKKMGVWSPWVQIWTTRDFTTTNIQQWNYMAQYGLQLNADFTVHTGSGLMISDDHFGGESGIIDNKQRRFVAAKIGEYYKYGSGDKDGLEGINYHLEKKNIGIGGDADSKNKVRVQGCVKALENFRSKDERPDTIFIPNGETATLRDEIINDESEYAIRLDPHEYEIDPSGSLEIDDRNRLIHVIGEQIKMVVDFRKIYPKQQIVIYNFDQNGGTMAVKIQGKTIASLSARCFLRLYVTKSSRVIAERQQPCEFVW